MPKDELKARSKKMEEAFFQRAEEEKLQAIRKFKERQELKENLSTISGVKDEALLDQLIELEIRPDAFSAVSLIPLVFVAWADGKVDRKERGVLTDLMSHHGIEEGSLAHERLEFWLTNKPDDSLYSTWKDYMTQLLKDLDGEQKSGLKLAVSGRARMIAEATGGFLGMGDKISKEEKAMIEKIESIF